MLYPSLTPTVGTVKAEPPELPWAGYVLLISLKSSDHPITWGYFAEDGREMYNNAKTRAEWFVYWCSLNQSLFKPSIDPMARFRWTRRPAKVKCVHLRKRCFCPISGFKNAYLVLRIRLKIKSQQHPCAGIRNSSEEIYWFRLLCPNVFMFYIKHVLRQKLNQTKKLSINVNDMW